MVIIVKYPMWKNGKFIINCLGLSDKVVLQDKGLAQQQMDGQLTPAMKLEEILRRLESETKGFRDGNREGWKDLELGCEQLFGFNATKSWKHCVLSTEVEEAEEKGLMCPIIAHIPYHERNLLKFFGDVPIIELRPPEEWLYYEDQFLDYIKQLYEELGLDDFDEEKIIVYYRAYIKKLKEVGRLGDIWPPRSH